MLIFTTLLLNNTYWTLDNVIDDGEILSHRL